MAKRPLDYTLGALEGTLASLRAAGLSSSAIMAEVARMLAAYDAELAEQPDPRLAALGADGPRRSPNNNRPLELTSAGERSKGQTGDTLTDDHHHSSSH